MTAPRDGGFSFANSDKQSQHQSIEAASKE
jgi:hypothetical protein